MIKIALFQKNLNFCVFGSDFVEAKTLTSRGIPKAQEVEPFKNIKDIEKLKSYFKERSLRNYTIFVVGINVGLRAGDLLSLKVGDVRNKERTTVTEEKTSKTRTFEINKSASVAIRRYLNKTKLKDSDYLFPSRKGFESLTPEAFHKIVKKATKDCEIKGNFGTHSLRKTFGYHIYKNNIDNNPGIVHVLQKIFGHSSESVTLNYIGITKTVIGTAYMDLNL